MVEVASPYKHPETGVYYIRRQIPVAIRAAFGGKQLHKVSLRTTDAQRAAVLFLKANGDLENQFEQARVRLAVTGSPLPSGRDQADDLVAAYFHGGPKVIGGLDGAGRLVLARLQLDRGLWNEQRTDGKVGFLCYPGPASTEEWLDLTSNAALLTGHQITKKHVAGLSPGEVWRWSDDAFEPGARDRQLTRLLEQFALHLDVVRSELPAKLSEAIEAYLTSLPIKQATERKPRSTTGRLRPNLSMTDLFNAWLAEKKPSAQTANEFLSAVRAFVDLVGDITVAELDHDDLLNFRDAVAKLPAAMSKVDRALSFTDQFTKFADIPDNELKRVGAATVKKKVGGIQALLSFAASEHWISVNVGRDVPIRGYSKVARTPRRTFEEGSLIALFSSQLFMAPGEWNWDRRTTDCTAYWLFFLSATTGARIEELGQALLQDVKRSGDITYIDIDDYSDQKSADATDATKTLKTANSRRVVPIHNKVLTLGFAPYCEALRASGQTRLFPDLIPNKFGKRTQNASRRVNALIDKLIDRDARYVFHSFRHGFGDLAGEAGVDGRVIDQIRGHAPTTVGGQYGQGVRLPALNRFFHEVTWAFLPWEDLTCAASAIDWLAVARHHQRRAAR